MTFITCHDLTRTYHRGDVEIRPLAEVSRASGGPEQPAGVRQLGHAGMRRMG